MDRRLVGWAMWTLLLLVGALTQAAAGPDGSTKTAIPEIARIAKIRIGYSTQEDLARHWGEGKTIIGGHPNTGRVWRIRGTEWSINTDGFDYSERGLVVDAFSLQADPDLPKDVPYARLSKREFAWLGNISLGMSRKEVIQILKHKSLPFTLRKDQCEINAPGFSALTSIPTPFRNWNATLTFTNGTLIKLTLGAGPAP